MTHKKINKLHGFVELNVRPGKFEVSPRAYKIFMAAHEEFKFLMKISASFSTNVFFSFGLHKLGTRVADPH
jgi:hypothetical protein